MHPKNICIVIAFLFLAFNLFAIAQPPWCPDLTNDNFVSFDDFAIQANNWLQSGPSLRGDFYNDGIVDIYDVDYLADWWLRDCYNPPPICPDCTYPDCNLMDCNIPPSTCEYCPFTPLYLQVTITGNHGCGCIALNPWVGSIYVSESNNINGTFLVPFYSAEQNSYCEWRGVYNLRLQYYVYPNSNDCSSVPIYPDHTQVYPVRISVVRDFYPIQPGNDPENYLQLTISDDYDDPNNTVFYGLTTNMTNCYGATIGNEYICDPNNGPLWGGGTAIISSPMINENQNTLVEYQKELIQLKSIATSWLQE